uniref:Uncharacterized protein n=1 Tax=Bombyx mori TaxID=7091 RepID=A0A8R2APT8_BOMMO|nr:uncharacterized protein LOC101738184 [Bombyx mori]
MITKTFVAVLAFCVAVGALSLAEEYPETNNKIVPKPIEYVNDEDDTYNVVSWTSCNLTETPIFSCHDCNTRMFCNPIGGLLISCRDNRRPHCNRGLCKSTPSDECAQ